MQTENEKTSERAVMTAMAKFHSDLWFVDDFREQPEYLSETFETILLTEMGDNQDLRINLLKLIKCWQKQSDHFLTNKLKQPTVKLLRFNTIVLKREPIIIFN